MASLLSVHNLTYQYQGTSRPAVTGVSFEIKQGQSVGFLGENGAGKTTLISCVLQKLSGYQGKISVFGNSSYGAKEFRKVGYAPQSLALFHTLSIEKNLDFFAGLLSLSNTSEQVNKVLDFVDLGDRRKQKVSQLSGGMKRRVNLAVALLADPDLILLDEPTVGVDPQTRHLIFEKLETLKKNGTSLIYTTHYMEEVERLCEKVLVLSQGRLLYDGTLNELKSRYEGAALETCYLKLTSEKEQK